MITRQDVLELAVKWQLDPQVIEKDYVLGWVLAMVSRHQVAGNYWVFKGGTSIKKCYIETYRFSEDLDFSLLPIAPYTKEEIMKTLEEITDDLHQLSGIIIPKDQLRVDITRDKLNRPAFKTRLYYQGPLGRARNLPGINFDITNNEPIVITPLRRPLIHPYPDTLPSSTGVLSYIPEELLAEKTRALFERKSPRDLYDVIYLLEKHPELFDLTKTKEIFAAKCLAKNLKIPSFEDYMTEVNGSRSLAADWAQMLSHQLPTLPPFESHISRLPGLIQWLRK